MEGGLQSLPAMGFSGGALLGCAAGTLNAARIKGAHTAMKSGLLAAEEAARQLGLFKGEEAAEGSGAAEGAPLDMGAYDAAFRASWAGEELWQARNFRPGFKWGLIGGMVNAGLESFVLRGRAPWTLRHHEKPDHACLEPAEQHSPREYPKADGELTFDRPSALFLSGTNHGHDQPAHLRLRDSDVPTDTNLPVFAGPEERYCPAGVYEFVEEDGGDGGGGGARERLQINAQNCLHCKACDIKDPTQNIEWTVPEGGGGPGYTLM